jgi:hypothetical protein
MLFEKGSDVVLGHVWVPDRDAALNALRQLKEVALSHDLYVEEKKSFGSQRQDLAKQKAQIVAERSSKLRELQKIFSDGLTNPDRQATGYVLEDLLRERLVCLILNTANLTKRLLNRSTAT